jgi:hypothetical protein
VEITVTKRKVVWNKRPQAQDYAGASRYLDLVCALGEKQRILKAYRRARPAMFAAKDLLRASLLPLLPDDDAHVAADLKRVRKGRSLAPVLLVRGHASSAVPLTIADGYHRVCAICYFDENEPVPCFLV